MIYIGLIVLLVVLAAAWWLIEMDRAVIDAEDRKEDDAALEQQTWDQAYMRRKVRAGENHE